MQESAAEVGKKKKKRAYPGYFPQNNKKNTNK